MALTKYEFIVTGENGDGAIVVTATKTEGFVWSGDRVLISVGSRSLRLTPENAVRLAEALLNIADAIQIGL